MDLAKGEKAVAIAAIFYEGRLKRWFDAGHPRQINIASKRLAGFRFEVEILDFAVVENRDTHLFGVGRVDQHLFCHCVRLRNAGAGPAHWLC